MQVLLVDGQEQDAELLARNLQRHGHDIVTVGTGGEALDAHRDVEIVLIDLDLPDIDGLEVCRRIRHSSDKPIISFTDPGGELNRILSLQAGSDDCMDKPYRLHELLARMDAVMRRARRRADRPSVAARMDTDLVSIGTVCIDPLSREVRRNGSPVQLTQKEFDLLYYLARNSNAVVGRHQLMTEIWKDRSPHALSIRASRTIDTHVSSLRRKLGSNCIHTVRGIGFRMGRPM